MAKRKQPAALAAYQAGLRSHSSTPQTIVVRPAAPVAKKQKHRRSVGGGHSSDKVLMGMAVGGFALGFVDKSGTAIPTIPILGRAGTIALACHFIGKGKPGMLTDIRNAAAAVAAYEMGSTGKVSGEEGVSGPL
jgi:hypothetical protein